MNILIADKQLVPEEKGFFKDVIMMIEKDEILYELIESIKKRESAELGALTTAVNTLDNFSFYQDWSLLLTGKSQIQKLICLHQLGQNSIFQQKPQNKFCIG